METDRPRLGDLLWPAIAVASFGCGPPGAPTLEAGGDDETGSSGSGSGSGSASGSGSGDAGDGDGDGVPPELLTAWTDKTGAFLLLRFSEPMADPTGVDPADFRISFGMTFSYDYYGYAPKYENSRYVEPNVYFAYSAPANAIAITPGSQPTDLFVKFGVPIEPAVCTNAAYMQQEFENVNQLPEYEARAGLFPHYSPGAVPVTSAQGQALAPIGPEWVELQGEYLEIYEYGFPNLSPQIPMGCIVEP
ncbi:hypothetical protein [Enhygromyxa salina]|uniref:Lipoprotein n=1 Tax=Enhygromyxa salina TaxID=215803 RepID=A0A2S9YS46_9BACT|nr:hypothetical protein [Enhygromyxa salina]PRQ07869.1 hypothetical protein ENSA7_24340 [Enhygromyxa salina]